MRNCFAGYRLAVTAFLAVASLSGCMKKGAIFDNDQVVVKPFSMYVCDTNGLLYHTNDGSEYTFGESKTTDGAPMRAIATSGTNIVFVKNGAYVSTDNGDFFNPIGATASVIGFNQSMILDAKNLKRIYLASNSGKGIIYSDSNGKRDTWRVDNSFVTDPGGIIISSFTQLTNGTIFALDHVNEKLFSKPNLNTGWTEVSMSGFPGGGILYLAHFGNTLVIVDYAGGGAWYSTNNGSTWGTYTGLPTGTSFPAAYAPFDQTLLIGTTGKGVYRFDPSSNSFSPANNGLEANIIIRGIATKDNLYKNNVVRKYIFMATNKGVYRSEDLGQNWFLVKGGNYTTIH